MTSTGLVWSYFEKYRLRLFGSMLLAAVTVISTVSLLGISGWLIARAAQMPPIMYLNVAIVGVRTFALLRSVTRYSERLLSHDATFRSLIGLRIALYEKLDALTPMRPNGYSRGDLISRVVTDVEEIQNLPLRVVLPIGSSILASLFSIALMTWLLPLAGLWLALTLVFASTLIPWTTTHNLVRLERNVATLRGELSEKVIEHFAGLTDILMLGAADFSLTSIKRTNDELLATERANAVRLGIANALLSLLQGLALIATTTTAITAVTRHHFSPVTMVVISLLPLAAFESVMGLPLAVASLARISGSADRLAEILQTQVESDVSSQESIVQANLGIEDVTLQWSGSSNAVVSDLSFDVGTRDRIGIVGPSGSGKSTIVQMLIKFLLPSKGTYRIDNKKIQQFSGLEVRSHIVATGNDAHLFATSVRENLKLATTEDLSDAKLWKVLDSVQLSTWVKTLPNGLDTIVGENGSSISGGQRQRLLIARMFIRNPQVWVLDEPTEHLDTALASSLMAEVHRASQDSALIVVSHRPADVAGSNAIVGLLSSISD